MSEAAEQELASELRRLIELREKRDSTKVAADKANDEYRECEAEIYESMEHGPFKGSRKVDLGEPYGEVTFTPRATPYGRVLPGMEDAALQYFSERGELDTMTNNKVIASRLNEIVKDRLEAGAPMPPGVDFYFRRGVTITRKNK